MALADCDLTLDIVKSPFAARSQRVCVRVGDRGAYRLSVALLKDGSPLPMSGLSATLKAVLADGTYAEAACAVDDAAAGLVSCTLGGAFASVPGACREAYVEVAQGASVVGSTGSFELLVERGADLSAGQARAYASRVDALVERAEGLADGLAATIASADITVSAARLDPGSEPTATVTGSGLAKHVELGIPSATAGVSCEAGPADMVTVHGAAEDAPLVEACVYGETRQNLWANPVGESNGIKAVENTDGSVTVYGTAINSGQVQSKAVYTLKPGAEYNASGGDIFVIYEINGNSSIIATHVCNGATFITSLDMKRCIFALYSDAGVTRTGTYRVMLNEGDTPAPWSPPGLASVEGVDVESAGINLVNPNDLVICAYSRDVPVKTSTKVELPFEQKSNSQGIGVVLPCRAGVTYTCSYCGPTEFGTAGMAEYVSYDDILDPGNNIGYIIAGLRSSQTYTAKGDGVIVFMVASKWTTGGTSNLIDFTASDIAVSIGESAEYSAYNGSSCPVPLPAAHPYLASLPDGTRDELRVYWDGTAELVANTFTDTVDGSSPVVSDMNNGKIRFRISSSHKIGTSNVNEYNRRNAFCNKLKVNNNPVDKNDSHYNIAAHEPNSAFYFNLGENEDSLDKAKTWLSSNELIILYKIASPIHYFYDGTTWSTTRPARGSLPTLRSAGDPTHVWAATEPTSVPAKVGAHVLLEGGKALGAEHDYVRRAVDALAAAQSVSESE